MYPQHLSWGRGNPQLPPAPLTWEREPPRYPQRLPQAQHPPRDQAGGTQGPAGSVRLLGDWETWSRASGREATRGPQAPAVPTPSHPPDLAGGKPTPTEGTWPGQGHSLLLRRQNARLCQGPGPPRALPVPPAPSQGRIPSTTSYASCGKENPKPRTQRRAPKASRSREGGPRRKGGSGSGEPDAQLPGPALGVGGEGTHSPQSRQSQAGGSLLPPSGGQARCTYPRGRPRPSSSGSWPRGCRR